MIGIFLSFLNSKFTSSEMSATCLLTMHSFSSVPLQKNLVSCSTLSSFRSCFYSLSHRFFLGFKITLWELPGSPSSGREALRWNEMVSVCQQVVRLLVYPVSSPCAELQSEKCTLWVATKACCFFLYVFSLLFVMANFRELRPLRQVSRLRHFVRMTFDVTAYNLCYMFMHMGGGGMLNQNTA